MKRKKKIFLPISDVCSLAVYIFFLTFRAGVRMLLIFVHPKQCCPVTIREIWASERKGMMWACVSVLNANETTQNNNKT